MKNFKKIFVIFILTLSVFIGIYFIGGEQRFLPRAFRDLLGIKAHIVVNLTDTYAVDEFPWQNFAQGGEEKSGMLDSVTNLVTHLDPDYVRIDHIYDFYEPVSKDASGNITFDWQKLDQEILTILSTGAKPFLSLSYMPPAISSGSEVDLPTKWQDWQYVVQKTIEHVSGVNGLAISGVYYEVWNEPDLFGDFRLYGSKNYLELYKYASLGAQEAKGVLPFKLGGPATTGLYKNWQKQFLDYALQENLLINFYSWHRYSDAISDYEEDIRLAKEWILDHHKYAGIEFIITESGFDSEVDRRYDEKFSAIHTIALASVAFDQIPRVFTFEIKDGPGPEKKWGRWGLLTHEQYGKPEKKPRYQAFEFLNQMQGLRYLTLGEGTWVKGFAVRDGNITKLLLVNYDPLGKHAENVPITFVNLASRRFKFTRKDFMGETKSQEIETFSESWETTQFMPANSASIFEIAPL